MMNANAKKRKRKHAPKPKPKRKPSGKHRRRQPRKHERRQSAKRKPPELHSTKLNCNGRKKPNSLRHADKPVSRNKHAKRHYASVKPKSRLRHKQLLEPQHRRKNAASGNCKPNPRILRKPRNPGSLAMTPL